jgi:hypothetical protein
MEPTALAQAASAVATVGALSLVIALLNIVALRAVRVDELPGCVQGRIRWWGAHNSAFLVLSAVLTAAGLAGRLAT